MARRRQLARIHSTLNKHVGGLGLEGPPQYSWGQNACWSSLGVPGLLVNDSDMFSGAGRTQICSLPGGLLASGAVATALHALQRAPLLC
jgi:hypothetical protein